MKITYPILFSFLLIIPSLSFGQIDHLKALQRTKKVDSILRAHSKDILDFSKVKIKSKADGLEIPSYIFQPLEKGTLKSRPALVWVYGGIHDYFGTNYFPFIKEAVAKGYIVIAPEYRGASGYGADFYNALDYGGYEVEDIISAGEYLVQEYPSVDPERMGVIGWSHGGYISLLATMRKQTLFSCVVASVPVSNLIFRLSYKGPEYQKTFISQKRIGALPHEKRELYLQRSPLYQVDHLGIPLLALFATNDDDVDFVEAEQLVNALKVKKSHLAETVIYKDPEHGHYLNRQVDLKTLTRKDDKVQTDAWNRTWRFLDWHLGRK
ncbi:MAG: prolyl oligopeptidase family serine peptidase [Bacteroidota bacterium]